MVMAILFRYVRISWTTSSELLAYLRADEMIVPDT